MLDKSIPYFDMTMRCPSARVRECEPRCLPEGFRYRMYRPGDMHGWALLETSVDEFGSVEKAEAYFAQNFLPYEDQLGERMCFIVDESDKTVATATAWYMKDELRRWALLHWVACAPHCQGRALGRAVIERALSLFREYEPGQDVYLHTQTWSARAVGIYLRFGFALMKTEAVGKVKNEHALDAVEALRDHMEPSLYRLLLETMR